MIEEIRRYEDGKIVERGSDISFLFSNWKGKNEKIVVLGPHDDDPYIGVALLLQELIQIGIDVEIALITDGRRGYTDLCLKNSIVKVRKKETEQAYECIGISKDKIKRFNLPDSDLYKHAFVWEYEEGKNNGLVALLIKYFREIGATRFLLPNENDFHLDHQATFHAGLYAAIQASEPIVQDLGESSRRDTILRYGVWSPFNGKPTHSIRTSEDTLQKKLEGILKYESQALVIPGIIAELNTRGPYEYFQEFEVKSFPADEYRKEMYGG